MTTAELKKYLKKMDKDRLEEALLELYKAQPKNKKEVFEITIVNINEGKPAPPKNAEVPSLKQNARKMEAVQDIAFNSRSVFYGYLSLSKKRRARTLVLEVYDSLIHCPVQSQVYDEACDQLFSLYNLVSRIMNEDNGYAYGLDLWTKLRQSPDGFFGLVISRILEKGISRTVLEELLRKAVDVFADGSDQLMELYETFFSRLKVGDVRFELLEMMEDNLRNPVQFSRPDETSRDSEVFWSRFVLLYLFLACEEIGYRSAMDFLTREADPALRASIDVAIPVFEAYAAENQEDQRSE